MGGLQPWHWIIVLLVLAVVVGGGIALVLALTSRSRPRPKAPMAPSGGVAPGWYPDPKDPTALRYFDGRNWVTGPPPS